MRQGGRKDKPEVALSRQNPASPALRGSVRQMCTQAWLADTIRTKGGLRIDQIPNAAPRAG